MYRHWKEDPKSVHVSWATYFSGLDKGLPSASAFTPPPGFIGGAGSAALTESGPGIDVSGAGDVSDYLKVSQALSSTPTYQREACILTRVF